MALINNNKWRKVDFVINQKINDEQQNNGDFPKNHSITDAFGAFSAITIADLEVMTDGVYATRLNGFYDFLEQTYSFFDRSQVNTVPSGTDAVLCPITNDPAPVITLAEDPRGYLEAVNNGGTLNDHLTWEIQITDPAPNDVVYDFQIRLMDKNYNQIRIINVAGIIRKGQTLHRSYYDDGQAIYIDETYNNMLAPLSVEYVAGSAQLSL